LGRPSFNGGGLLKKIDLRILSRVKYRKFHKRLQREVERDQRWFRLRE
jgi:hypothetical protein